MTMKEKIGEY